MSLKEKKSLSLMAFENSLPFLLLKFTLVSNNSGARGYLPETIFVGVSYLLLDFCFFFSCCCYNINETPHVMIAVLMCCFVI